MVAAVWLAGRPTVRGPLGREDPPAAVATQPDLFRDYAIIRKLDALEHFDAVLRYPSEELHPEATRQRRT